MCLIDRSLGGEVSHDGDFMIFEANRYSRKGFLFKSFAMSAVVGAAWKPIVNISVVIHPWDTCSISTDGVIY